MEGTQYTTKEAILKKAQKIKGIPLRDIDATGRLATGKGAIGTVIEESWFGYSPNSESEPDFPEVGVELKVTPYIRGRNGIRAKERLVCNIINYMEEYDKTFYTSAFWHKCNTMLLMSYEHLADRPKGDFHIDEAILFSFPEEDLIIIEHDWETIINKVRAGKAHEISEGDTLYLAACTKGANAGSVRPQPFSPVMAKQRAYSLKSSYMTQILNKYIFGDVQNPRIIRHWSFLQHCTFEDYIIRKVSEFYGRTRQELKTFFGVESNAKSLNEILLARMLNVSGRIAYTEEFQKAGIIPKTIRVQYDGSIRESMSFPTFDFIELSREDDWEDSDLYNYLAPTKFMFVIFQQRADDQYVFDRVMFWNIPNEDLEQVRLVWERTVHIIREGVQLIPTARGISNNLPKKTENPVAHVRPHGVDASDKLPLPDGRMMTKQCFWLNNTYIAEQISRR
ncbi:MAG: restriction endonuclease [Negativicoccus succinicivorans]|uniref:Sau3AI family type II restriction endonuclease n=1 Tax=Negativicoccus succinicivorans TaxID=620903 RepID=UPI0026F1307D|nr:Sau3AI family type II restriction endonuclease [Negativicoccus succinicivorans]MBS6028013.1 restriction endonuclease [Negativicoccus succinicivorans]